MPIISKETWDKFTQEEKEIIRCIFGKLDKNTSVNASMEYIHLFGKENLQPQPLTYENVARELFKGKDVAFIDSDGDIDGFRCTLPNTASKPNVCSSQKQAEKLLAINKLLNVARFLNGKDWKPDWDNANEEKWFPCIGSNGKIEIHYATRVNYEIVYFRTEELANQAIQILGEDTVRLALGDY